ncbi:MAG TPA: NCS2 family permease [Candidatus Avipropionibacterium avicola]|uniref:NCS2 family permease n=1 Tax=Candidatus Avipropionibacterium avicola TaxID=2840701 RepID=A0A9D1KMY5_9ACTN|nr:NCS2 family permease [Candidatus Avipropionibacterium avicola]
MVSKSPKAVRRPAAQQSSSGPIDRWFEISKRGSTVPTEVIGGLVTFFAMAYILALNPLIIGTATDVLGNFLGGIPGGSPDAPNLEGMAQSKSMVAAATALVAGVMSILMGVIGRFPIALATGLGLNAVVAFTVAAQFPWEQAMALVVWEGIFIALLVFTGFRTAVFRAVPPSLRSAISVGIGMFVALVGLANAGIVRTGGGLIEMGVAGSLRGWPMAIFVFGLIVLIVLQVLKVRGSLLLSILAATIAAVIVESVAKVGVFIPASDDSPGNPTGWMLNVPTFHGVVDTPDLGLIGRVDMFGAFTDPKLIITALLLVFALMLADFFDTMGTVVAVGAEGNLLDSKGNPPHLSPILVVDSLGAAAGGLGSVSSNTAFVESTSGVAAGARTGLASVVTGVAFLIAMFFAPIINMVPSEAASPVLLFVGFLMMGQITKIDWDDIEDALPAFLTIALMPFTYSITTGMGAGFIVWVLLKVLRGKVRTVHPLLWVISIAFVIYFIQGILLDLVQAG